MEQIIPNANAQEITNIFNALAKIPGEGRETKEFFSKIDSEKWQQILSKASDQHVANIFNASSKILGEGKEVEKFYAEVSRSGKLEQIIRDADAQSISLILNALSKIPGEGKEVEKFYAEVSRLGKLEQIIPNANAQEISNIFNALSKIKGDDKEAEEFYDEVSKSNKWQQILQDANSQNISNIFNALAKINDGGTKVKAFYDEIGGQEGLNKFIPDASAKSIYDIFNSLAKIPGRGEKVSEFYDKISTLDNDFGRFDAILDMYYVKELATIIKTLADSEEGAKKLNNIYDKITSTGKLERIIADPNSDSDEIFNILTSFSKSREASKFMGNLCNDIYSSRPSFLNISKIMGTLRGIEDGGQELVKEFYNNTKKDYTKTGSKILQYRSGENSITNSEAILLDLHGFNYDTAKIVTKLFLDEARDGKNQFYIECGRGTHSSSGNEEKMPDLIKEVLDKEGFDIVKTVYRCFEVKNKNKELDLGRAPSASANLRSGKALDTHTQGGGTSKG